MEAQELGELAAILGVFVNTKLDILSESLVELVEVVFVFGDLGEEIHAFLDDVLTDDLENLVLLERLARNVERQVLGVDDALDEVEVLRDEVFTIIHDEDAANVEHDIVAFLLRLEEVEGSTMRPKDELTSLQETGNTLNSPFGDEENRLELKLTLDGEVFDGEMVFPVVRQTFVERTILLGRDVRRVARPDGLGLVKLLVLDGLFLDFLGLLLLILLVVHLLNFRLVFRLLHGLILVLNLL